MLNIKALVLIKIVILITKQKFKVRKKTLNLKNVFLYLIVIKVRFILNTKKVVSIEK